VKEDSEQISSDGEFNDAKNMNLMDADCTEVLEIQLEKDATADNLSTIN
jgi:hypothetical protein